MPPNQIVHRIFTMWTTPRHTWLERSCWTGKWNLQQSMDTFVCKIWIFFISAHGTQTVDIVAFHACSPAFATLDKKNLWSALALSQVVSLCTIVSVKFTSGVLVGSCLLELENYFWIDFPFSCNMIILKLQYDIAVYSICQHWSWY